MQLASIDYEAPALQIAAGSYHERISAADISGKFAALTHRPEKRALHELEAVRDQLNLFGDFLADLIKEAESGNFEPLAEAARFARNYIEAARDYWHAESRCLNWFVTGRGNFPVARNEKRMRASDNKLAYMRTLRERARKACERRACPYGRKSGPIRQNDPQALEKLAQRIEDRQAAHVWMKRVNRAWRKAGKPGAEPSDAWAQIAQATNADLEDFDLIRRDMRLHPIPGVAPFPSFALNNARAEISRLESRVDAIKAVKDRHASPEDDAEAMETDAGAVRVVRDGEAMRLRLYFDGKPPKEFRDRLKLAGFRWSPTAGAWQRNLNNASEAALATLKASDTAA